jgi:hypothetical protein
MKPGSVGVDIFAGTMEMWAKNVFYFIVLFVPRQKEPYSPACFGEICSMEQIAARRPQ